jgi:hypothetical protein
MMPTSQSKLAEPIVVSDDECSTSSLTKLSTKPVSMHTKRRRVDFISQTEVIPAPSPLEELCDWAPIWYQVSEMDQFRKEARDICRHMRVVHSVDNSNQELHLAMDGHTRGLEQRFCLERQRRRFLANRVVVRAQVQMKGERLAEFAEKCTSWASQLAVTEGARDFERAYDETVAVPAIESNKRTHEALDMEHSEARRVRRCI